MRRRPPSSPATRSRPQLRARSSADVSFVAALYASSSASGGGTVFAAFWFSRRHSYPEPPIRPASPLPANVKWCAAGFAVVLGCTRAQAPERRAPSDAASPPIVDASTTITVMDAADTGDASTDAAEAGTPHAVVDGPHTIDLAPARPIFYAFPKADPHHTPPFRLVAHLHGVCGAPSYACGKWIGAGVDVGAMVCPTGNAKCGDSPYGPPSWEAPTWGELVLAMDRDLETSIRNVEAKHRGTIQREGAVLTGYSRGAYAALPIARAHPGRYPYLVLIEANVPATADGLVKSGVRAVALVAGEKGDEIAGLRKTEATLTAAGFPARLFVMPNTGHLYSDDMERVMSEALAFVLAH